MRRTSLIFFLFLSLSRFAFMIGYHHTNEINNNIYIISATELKSKLMRNVIMY